MASSEVGEVTQLDISKRNMATDEGYDKKCIFCKVVNKEMGTELLHCVSQLLYAVTHFLKRLFQKLLEIETTTISHSFDINECHSVLSLPMVSFMIQDEEISCFRDIKPGAPHHYLIVPTKHVGNCKSLTKAHVPLGRIVLYTAQVLRFSKE